MARLYGCLYVRSPDFKNRDKRQVAIEEIATKLAQNGMILNVRNLKISTIFNFDSTRFKRSPDMSDMTEISNMTDFSSRPCVAKFSRKLRRTREETALPGNFLSCFLSCAAGLLKHVKMSTLTLFTERGHYWLINWDLKLFILLIVLMKNYFVSKDVAVEGCRRR